MPDSDANSKKKQTQEIIQNSLPPMEMIQQQLGSAKSMAEKLLEAELCIGYKCHPS